MTQQLPTISGSLPPLYKEVAPLTSEHHEDFGLSQQTTYGFAAQTNSFPLAIDEFAAAQRHYPILFTKTETPMPAALVSVEAGQNPYICEDGTWKMSTYVPAYVRRYPFLLIRAQANNNDYALCFDTTADHVGQTKTNGFFADGEATQVTKSIMDFCVAYEKSIESTRRTCREIAKLELFTDPSIKITKAGKTVELKGLQIVDEKKLRELPAGKLAELATSGILSAIYAHLFSLAAIGQLEGISTAIERLEPQNVH